jgi:hypothetical protein
VRFQTAMGSANEVRACIETADALGYLEPTRRSSTRSTASRAR